MLAYTGLHICWTEVLSDKSCSYHVGTQTYQSDYPCTAYFVLTGIHFYDASSFCPLSHPVDLFSLYCFPRPHDSIPENRVFQNVPLCSTSMCLCMYNLWKDKRAIPWRTLRCFSGMLYYSLLLWIVHLLLFPTELSWNAFYLFIYFRILSDRTLKKVSLWHAKKYT